MSDTPKKTKNSTFLTKLYTALRELFSANDTITRDQFEAAFKTARGHAGGKAWPPAAAAAEGDPTGVAVMLPIPQDVAASLAIAGGEAAADLHITIGYVGKRDDMTDVQLAEALLAVRDAGICCAPFTATIGGIGRFMASAGSDAKDVVYLSVDSPALNELRDEVEDALEEYGIELAADHGFTPHITLAYIDPGAPLPIESVDVQTVTFRELALWAGPQRMTVPLVGMRDDEHEVAMQQMASELADLAATGHTHRLFNAWRFAEPPEWIPYLPKPGTYKHPRYGDIVITRERNARFVEHFARKVYQDRLPIDAEHETKLSGAVGWIVGMRQNSDGSADARVDWTDRARPLFAAERFRFFSPEWYDAWQRPETGEIFKDVAIGGALTTRPFFKDPALRPLFASEGGLLADEPTQPQTQEGDTMAEQQFAELQAQLETLRAENAALKQTSEAAETNNKQLAERLAAVEKLAQQQRLRELITTGPRWFGEVDKHLGVLTTLVQTFGETSDEVASYVQAQRATAEALKQSKIFDEVGSDSTKTETDDQKLERLARERATVKGMPFEQAYSEILIENPALYSA